MKRWRSILIFSVIGLCGICYVIGLLAPDDGPTPETRSGQVALNLDTATPLPPTETSTPIPPTATATPTPTPTVTKTPRPTNTPIVGPKVIITGLYKGQEFVTVENIGSAAQDLAGWRLFSERGAQDCYLWGVVEPGQTLFIWAMAENVDEGGFNCGFETNIWNNSEPDAAILYNADGVEVAQRDGNDDKR
jgi:hypothetical protein